MNDISNLKPVIRLSVKNPESGSNSVFGRGVADLCQGVLDTGSLNASAKAMHMAYSKAWRIMKETEKALGFQLLNRDGAHGSTLTDEGMRLLSAYYKVNTELEEYANKKLAEYLQG